MASGPQALRDEIEAANKKFMACFKAQDANALSMLYTEDCKVMATGMDVQTGRQGVVKVFGGTMTNGVKEVLLVIQVVGPLDSDNYCYERSEYTMYGADKKVVDQGKYVVIWHKIDGTWYLYTDIFNTNLSPSK
ncbi:uncharacterized protein [Dysidea avara]|uniref:uncharacterized protein n=1 Tax=Dysidea avara TaxID=196820 RepID=UPI003328D572